MIKCEVICSSDFGMDCDFESRDETGKEILKESTEHGRKNHGMEEISQEFVERVRETIRDDL